MYYDDAKRLVMDALELFSPVECSECQAPVIIGKFISEDDVDKFVREHRLVTIETGYRPY